MYRVSTVARRIDAISRSPAAQRHIAEETMRLLEPIRQRLLNKRPYMLAGELIRAVQGLKNLETRMVSLAAKGQRRGRLLFSYMIDPFLLPPDSPVLISHTHYWESLRMVEIWREAGYDVDVINWTNRRFVPQQRYDILIDVRHNMERLVPLLNADCLRVLHIETAHWLTHTTAQMQRLLALQQRRAVTLPPDKEVRPNQAIEVADCATILGNEFTQESFRYAGKPMFRIPISTPVLYPWPEGKDFAAARRRFLWIGSNGFVHKGLDLVLDAFVGMPDFHLTIAGPTKAEPHFLKAFQREMFGTANISTIGWINVTGDDFTRLAAGCLGLVYPSCSEGGGGVAITCMHAGLIPVVSRETSVDVTAERGVVLPDTSVATIQSSIRTLASRPTDELETMARNAWEWARATHTKEQFSEKYRTVVAQVIADREQLIKQRQR